jgi:hypothetical protein
MDDAQAFEYAQRRWGPRAIVHREVTRSGDAVSITCWVGRQVDGYSWHAYGQGCCWVDAFRDAERGRA